MRPKCPDCKSELYVVYDGEDRPSESGELYEDKVYTCKKCNIEFTEDEQ